MCDIDCPNAVGPFPNQEVEEDDASNNIGLGARLLGDRCLFLTPLHPES